MAAQSAETGAGVITSTTGLHPNLASHMDGPLRYSAQNGDFVITNGTEFFNRSLYGGNTAFRVDGGDKPEFMMYLPRRGGNLRLGLQSGKRVTFDCSTQLTSRGQGRDVPGGAAAVLELALDPSKELKSLTVRALRNDVVIGLMSATLQRAKTMERVP